MSQDNPDKLQTDRLSREIRKISEILQQKLLTQAEGGELTEEQKHAVFQEFENTAGFLRRDLELMLAGLEVGGFYDHEFRTCDMDLAPNERKAFEMAFPQAAPTTAVWLAMMDVARSLHPETVETTISELTDCLKRFEPGASPRNILRQMLSLLRRHGILIEMSERLRICTQ